MKKFAVGLIGLAASIAVGRADIIPSFLSEVSTGGPNPNTVFSYSANITDEQNATTGDFFTIYDFGSIVPNSNTQPAGWTFSEQLVGVTPSNTNPNDNPAIMNLTWTYTGTTPIIGNSAAGKNIGPFSVTVLGPPSEVLGSSMFAAQGTLAAGPDAGTKVGNVGTIPVPIPVPEPSTFALIGIAGALLGVFGRRKS
jgi:hypothetical protein